MNIHKTLESYLNEGAWAKIMKDVKANSETGPWSIIAVEGSNVVGQEIDIKVKDMIPAAYEAMRKEYPKAKLHIEDATGAVVWNESIVTEAKAWDKLNKIAKKEYGEFGFATLSADEMSNHIDTDMADKLADKMFGEFGFASLSEDEMEELINKNPKVVTESVINEGKIQLKRKYTENYPTVSAGKRAPIRNKIIEAIADGKITEEEFTSMIKELSASSKKWAIKNARYFNVSEDGVSLSKYGIRVLNKIRTINESVSEETTNVNTMIHTTFQSFLNENYKPLFEAFKSSKLASLLDLRNVDSKVIKGLYQFTKVKLDQITDDQLVELTPGEAYKSKRPNALFFYVVDNEKENPYAEADAWRETKTIPGKTLLAIADGDNKFYGLDYGSRWSKDRTLKLSRTDGDNSIGINKKYRGWDASGLYNVKRISELADRVLVFDWSAMPSASDERDARSAAKAGAVAFMSDKEFKAENQKRYKEILQSRALNDDIDTMVEGAVNELADQIKTATKKMQLGKYGDLLIGTSPKGSEVKLRDASNHMSAILDSYSRYVDYMNQAKKNGEEGESRSEAYYTKEAAAYAKDIKERTSKIKKLEYAW